MGARRAHPLSAALCLIALAGSPAGADSRLLDLEQSTLTVHVSKAGLFSAFADNHIVRAPIARGALQDAPPLGIDIVVRTADMRVLDPGLSPDKRAEVQTRMLGPEVLDAERFGEITFASTRVEPEGQDRWRVVGNLAIHGRTRAVTVSVARRDGRYRGGAVIRQRDFGIEPISIAGGTVNVKDELRVEFDIVAR